MPTDPLAAYTANDDVNTIRRSLFTFIPVWILFVLTEACPHTIPNVQNLFMLRYLSILGIYFNDPSDFRRFMRTHHILVTGSVALHLWNGDHLWFPPNLDLLCTIHSFPFLHQYLLDNDYHASLGPIPNPLSRYVHTHPSTTELTPYVRANSDGSSSTIHILCSTTDNPVTPIFDFHSTITMNYVTADTIVSLYPSLTEAHRGIFQNLNVRRECESELDNEMRKYNKRGYSLYTHAPPHTYCDILCPNIVRCVGDTYTSYMHFNNSTAITPAQTLSFHRTWSLNTWGPCGNPTRRLQAQPY
ncbi:hypothetical protein SISNIDRAFT_488775 [Sistotremastrum niveocremeum HHB9708]|uniref:Uncharacterized protein n=1 Tax=Sistotremastrum niveocremeum HHB9708 TaxID=1314777 RepID=A0A164QS19_9AGAM|nr:hypothetical protein SISNIDRAFT_488775 [Sistotremastrum niveocremeum HHB9708]